MKNNIFENKILLTFVNKSLSENFSTKKAKKLSKFLKYILGINLIMSIISTIIVSKFLFSRFDSEVFNKAVIIMSYIICFINGVFFIISLFLKKHNVVVVFYYISYSLSPIYFFNLRVPITSEVTPLISLYIILLELCIKLIINLVFKQSFVENLMFTIPALCFLWAVYLPTIPSNIISFYKTNFAFLTAGYLLYNTLIYVIDRRFRISYYFRFFATKNSLWLKNVFETMDGGLISIKSNQIKYINSYLIDLLNTVYKDKHKFNFPSTQNNPKHDSNIN
jgi:hypothetical protein